MDSIGDKLKAARESQEFSLDQIARDTRISKRYIQAFEDEDFTIFPGEAYLIGFLRNYADYLGLDPDETVALYKNLKLQEQPIPMEELIHGEKKPPLAGWIIGGIVIVAAIVIGVVFLNHYLRGQADERELQQAALTEAHEFVLEGESEARWFNTGDVIKVALGDRTYSIEIVAIEKDLVLSVPGGSVQLDLSEKRFLDLDLDSKSDLQVVFNDIDLVEDKQRANLWLIKTASLMIEDDTVGDSSQGDVEGGVQPTGDTAAVIPGASESPAKLVILEAAEPRLFRVEIAFRGNCLLRYLLDGETRDQRFFQKAEVLNLDNQRRELKLWLSNAGAVQVKIEGREVTMGRPGQVATKTIRWVKPADGQSYQLEVTSTY